MPARASQAARYASTSFGTWVAPGPNAFAVVAVVVVGELGLTVPGEPAKIVALPDLFDVDESVVAEASPDETFAGDADDGSDRHELGDALPQRVVAGGVGRSACHGVDAREPHRLAAGRRGRWRAPPCTRRERWRCPPIRYGPGRGLWWCLSSTSSGCRGSCRGVHRTVVPVPVITGDIKNKVDAVWDAFWTGGISNPLEVMEQITYLLFIRRLDDEQTRALEKANLLGDPIEASPSPRATTRTAGRSTICAGRCSGTGTPTRCSTSSRTGCSRASRACAARSRRTRIT